MSIDSRSIVGATRWHTKRARLETTVSVGAGATTMHWNQSLARSLHRTTIALSEHSSQLNQPAVYPA